MAKSCHNRSFVEIESSSIFPLFRSVAGHANHRRRRTKANQGIRQRQRQRCTETATANGNGETATEERQRNGGNRALRL